MRHPSYQSSDPRFRHSTWIITANMPELSCWWLDNWDWRAVCVSPLIYSFCSRVTKGELGVCSLSSLRAADDGPRQESVEGNQVTVLPPLVAPQVKQTTQGHVPGHKHTHLQHWWDYTTVSNRNYILYKTIKFGGTMVAPLWEGYLSLNKIYRYMKNTVMISKICDIPIFGTCFSLGEKHVNTPHIFIINFFNHITKY